MRMGIVACQVENFTAAAATEGSFCEPREAFKVYNLKKYVPVKADWSKRTINDTLWRSNGTDALVLKNGKVGGPYKALLEALLEVT